MPLYFEAKQNLFLDIVSLQLDTFYPTFLPTFLTPKKSLCKLEKYRFTTSSISGF